MLIPCSMLQAGGDADYEPFPEKGQPVFTSHPAFTYDSDLRDELIDTDLYLLLIVKNGGSGTPIDDFKAWLTGKAPIPSVWLDEMLEGRRESLEERGLSPDLPIGWEKLEQMREHKQP